MSGTKTEASRDEIWDWLAHRLGLSRLGAATLLEDVPPAPSMLEPRVVARLAEIVGDEHVILEAETRRLMAEGPCPSLARWIGQGGTLPDAVIRPATPIQIAELLAFAYEAELGLAVAGTATGGSGLRSVAPGPSHKALICLSTARLDEIHAVDEASGIAVVGAGLTFAALEPHLRASGLRLAGGMLGSDGMLASGTVGGAIAGRRAVGRGPRTWLAAAKLVTPQGSWETEESPASLAGPDLTAMAIGSEGTLGILTEATLRLERLPETEFVELYAFPKWQTALDATRTIAQSDIAPALLSLSDPEEVGFVTALSAKPLVTTRRFHVGAGLGAAAVRRRPFSTQPTYLAIGLSGSKALVEAKAVLVSALMRDARATPLGADAAQAFLQRRRAVDGFTRAAYGRGLGLLTFTTAARWTKLADAHEAASTALGKVMGAIRTAQGARAFLATRATPIAPEACALRLAVLYPRAKGLEIEQESALRETVTAALHEAGAAVSHGAGFGAERAAWLAEEKGSVGAGVLVTLKQAIDPHAILNPGVMFG